MRYFLNIKYNSPVSEHYHTSLTMGEWDDFDELIEHCWFYINELYPEWVEITITDCARHIVYRDKRKNHGTR